MWDFLSSCVLTHPLTAAETFSYKSSWVFLLVWLSAGCSSEVFATASNPSAPSGINKIDAISSRSWRKSLKSCSKLRKSGNLLTLRHCWWVSFLHRPESYHSLSHSSREQVLLHTWAFEADAPPRTHSCYFSVFFLGNTCYTLFVEAYGVWKLIPLCPTSSFIWTRPCFWC